MDISGQTGVSGIWMYVNMCVCDNSINKVRGDLFYSVLSQWSDKIIVWLQQKRVLRLFKKLLKILTLDFERQK